MNIQRRPLIVSGMALVAVPRFVIAQTPARVWRVGVLVPAGSSLQLAPWGAFIAELSRLGYVEGRNLAFEIRHAGQNSRSLDNLAAELAGLKVDLVFAAAGTPSVKAAMKATTSIPIVMLSSAEPVRDGLVTSLARPGGNVTGNSIFGLELAVKRQQLISQALGKPSRIAYLASSSSRSLPHLEEYYAALTAAAKADGAQFEPTLLQSMGDLDAAFERIARQRPDALVLDNPAVFFAQAERFAALATRYRLPTIADGRDFAVAGLLMSYGLDYVSLARNAASYVDRVFKGANAGDLPVEQPTKFELVVNLKTAKALGITIPQSMLLRADEVIQ